jgi:opacity protein-like surface antigen
MWSVPRSQANNNRNEAVIMSRQSSLFKASAFFACVIAADVVVAQDLSPEAAESPIQVIGFADIDYVATDSEMSDGFKIGQVVGHIAASPADHLNVFGEFSATAHDSEYKLEVERIIARYDFNNDYSLSAGRYHTPIGYWNTAYHHGTWLQTSIGRPNVVRFGSPLVPIHFVGLLFEGDIPGSDHDVSYSFGVGNGRHSDIARAGDAGDINSGRAWNATLRYRPTSIRGLNAGVGIYSDLVNPAGGIEVDEKIYSAYFALERETPEVIVEFLHSDHDATSTQASGGMDAYYAQFAYRLKGGRQALKPYIRVEKTEIDQSDPLLRPMNQDYKAGIAGVRYDFASSAALKFEYRSEEYGNLGRDNSLQVQLSLVLVRD